VSRVAIAGSRFEDPDLPALVAALGALGVEAVGHAWDDPTVDWDPYDATVIRSTWDYPKDLAAFLSWTRRVPCLINEPDVVAWNADKRYLGDLAAAGVATIPTTYLAVADEVALPEGDVVVKPTVGGGSRGAARFTGPSRDEALAHIAELRGRGLDVMVQPFVEGAATAGETDVVVIDGEVSHALRKRVALRDVTSWEPSGPVDVTEVEPTAAELALVDAALAAIPADEPLCFARVDLVPADDGPLVIEIEAIEPFLFFSSVDPDAPGRLARAIARRLR
jgi:glutathione synthase/RimK-type ligase-like ATP-grasp enzyme